MINNNLGKTIKEITKRNDWVWGSEIGLQKNIQYSPVYTYLPIQQVLVEIENVLKEITNNNIKMRCSYDKKYIFFSFPVKVDNNDYKITVSVVNSEDKTKAFQVNCYITSDKNYFIFCFNDFRKVHRGRLNFDAFLKSLKDFLKFNLEEKNLRKVVNFYDQLSTVEIPLELIENIFPVKNRNKTQWEIFKSIRYYYYKIAKKDKVKLIDLLDSIFKFYITWKSSKLERLEVFTKRLIKELIDKGILIGL